MTTLRGAVAVFDDPQELESAVSALQSSGIDRAYLSFVAAELPTKTRDQSSSRESVVSDTDIRQERVLGTGLAATIAAFAAARFAVATGGVAVGAAEAAAGGVGAASTLVGRKLAKSEEAFLDEQLARGGVLFGACECARLARRGNPRARSQSVEERVADGIHHCYGQPRSRSCSTRRDRTTRKSRRRQTAI
jgi:hypothetical protein